MDEGHIKKPFRFVELDLESVVKRKIKKINKSKKLSQLFEKLNLKAEVSCTLLLTQKTNIYYDWGRPTLWLLVI